jgi:hypothetical protein
VLPALLAKCGAAEKEPRWAKPLAHAHFKAAARAAERAPSAQLHERLLAVRARPPLPPSISFISEVLPE